MRRDKQNKQGTRTAASGADSLPKRSRLRSFPLCLLPVLLLSVLVLEREPVADRSSAPDAQTVRGANGLYERVRLVQDASGAEFIDANWQELSAVATLGGRAAGVERIALAPENGQAHLRASLPLPLGFWLNGHLYTQPDDKRRLRLAARLGDLPIPAFMVHAGIGLARHVLRFRGVSIQPLDAMVLQVWTDVQGVQALVDLPSSTNIVNSIAGLVSERIDAQRVAEHYCGLVEAHRAEPATEFVEQVHRAFSRGDGTPVDNRALFVALSLLVAQIDGKALPGSREPLLQRCGVVPTEFTLQGRADLAKHWAVSAALASAFGTEASLSLGTWKEISDSGEGGSGFSLVDLAADRSGVFSALRGADVATAVTLRDWLRQVSEADLLPVGALALAEGMTEDEFRARFTDTDSAQFAAMVSRIDAQLAVLAR